MKKTREQKQAEKNLKAIEKMAQNALRMANKA